MPSKPFTHPAPPQLGPLPQPIRWPAGLITISGLGLFTLTTTLSFGHSLSPLPKTTIALNEAEVSLEAYSAAPPPPSQGRGPNIDNPAVPSPYQELEQENRAPDATDSLVADQATQEKGIAGPGHNGGQRDGVPGGVSGGVPGGVPGGVEGGSVGGVQGGDKMDGAVPPRFDAAYLRNPQPEYPMVSRRLSEEGQVVLRVLVGPEGTPERLEVKASSGFSRLDLAALEAVRRWRFVPAHQAGQPMPAWVLVPIRFLLRG